MKTPFTIRELDDLLNACINFTAQHEPFFYWGNVGGADGVTADSDAVTRMLTWLARTDEQLIEDCGHAHDDIRYF